MPSGRPSICACGRRKPAWRKTCTGCLPVNPVASAHIATAHRQRRQRERGEAPDPVARADTPRPRPAWLIVTCFACGERTEAVAIGNRLFSVARAQELPIQIRPIGRWPSPGLRCSRCDGTVEIAPADHADRAGPTPEPRRKAA